MADKTDDLIISISTDLATVRRSLKRLEGDVGNSTKKIEKQFDVMGRGINRSIDATASRLASTLAAAFSIRAAQQFVDASTRITNALKVAGLQGAELTNVYDKLFASAQKNAAPLESLVTLYSRLALTQKELGVTQAELVGFTDKVALALRVGGTSATEASGALLQLSQALGGGTVRAEEFNSVLEGAPTIVQAVAAGLTEAGGSVSKLRQLVIDGKLSSQAFFRAFEAGSVILEEKVASSVLTTSQSLEKLQNVLIDTAGKIDAATGASTAFGKVIEDLAVTIQQFGQVVVKAADGDLGKFLGWLNEGAEKAATFKRIMGGIPGIIEKMGKLNQDLFNGKPLGTTMSDEAIQSRINDAFAGDGAAPKTGRLPALPPAKEIKTVSIADLPAAGSDDKAAKKAETAATKAKNAYRDLLKSADDRIGQLKLESELLGQYGAATDAARFRLDLLQQSEDKGRSLSPDQRKEIEEKVAAYGKYSEALAQAKLQQDLLDAASMRGLSSQDQKVKQALRQYGLPEDLGGKNAGDIRKQLQLDEITSASDAFIDDLTGALLSGGEDIGKKLGQVVLNALLDSAQTQISGILKQVFGALMSGTSPGSPVGAIASAASSFAAPIGAVTRSALPSALPTGEIASYIAKAAAARGIDPATALAVAKSEGGLKSWNLQSQFVKNGVQEPSFGPFQLYKGGGLGNDFMRKTGMDPALAQNGPAGVDFALDHASKNGWGAWYGAKNTGIGNWEGIGKGAGSASAALEKLAGASTETTKGLGSLASSLVGGGGGAGLGGFASLFSSSFKPNTTLSAFLGVGANAKGTNSWSGGPTWVGEDGPEIVNAPKGAQIIPNHAIRKVQAPIAPRLNTRQSAAATNNGPSSMAVHINGASGDPHVKELVRQGVAQALAEKNDNDRRGGFGTTQQRYTAQKG